MILIGAYNEAKDAITSISSKMLNILMISSPVKACVPYHLPLGEF